VSEVYEKIRETGMPWATAMPPISVRYICRKSKRRGVCCAVEKIYDGEPSLAVLSDSGEDLLYNTVVSVKCIM
jgi:hypothetical protein